MKKSLLAAFILALPLSMNASVIYSYSNSFVPGKTIGFTYTTSDYLNYPNGEIVKIPASNLTCDMSGMGTGWDCTSAFLSETKLPNGLSGVSVTLAMVYTPDPKDAFSTDSIYDSFTNASLKVDGVYRGWEGGTLTVTDPPDMSPAPEPSSLLLILGTAVAAFGWKFRGSLL